MNFAFQALVLLVYVLPGIIFNRFSHPAVQFRERRAVADELTHGLIHAAILHSLWCAVFNSFGQLVGLRVDFHSAVVIAAGQFTSTNVSFEVALGSLSAHPMAVLGYFLSLSLVAAVAGKALGQFTESRQQPVLFDYVTWLFDHGPHVRSWTEWKNDLGAGRIPLMFFATVVKVGNVPYLYVGLLDEEGGIKYDDNGVPNRFVLQGAMRRRFEDPYEEFYVIKSDNLILRMSEITTINIWDIGIAIDENATATSVEPESRSV